MNEQTVFSAGKLRRTLQRKLRSNPSCCVFLIQALIGELEKCHVAAHQRNPDDKVITGELSFFFFLLCSELNPEGCKVRNRQSAQQA